MAKSCPKLRPTYPGSRRDFTAVANGVKYRVRHFFIGGWEVMASIGGKKMNYVGDKYGQRAMALATKAKAQRIMCDHAEWYRKNVKGSK